MPQFPWPKSLNRSSRQSHSSNSIYVEGQQQHPDLPLPRSPRSPIHRSTSVDGRQVLDNRRSIALFSAIQNPSSTYPLDTSTPVDYPADTSPTTSPVEAVAPTRSSSQNPGVAAGSAIVRAQTVAYREGLHRIEPIYEPTATEESGGAGLQHQRQEGQESAYVASPKHVPSWLPDSYQLQSILNDQAGHIIGEESASMTSNNAQGKTSSDSGSAPTGLDKWSQRRQQRYTTEQNFREQRQGGGAAGISPAAGAESNTTSFFQQVLNNTYTTQPDAAQPHHSSRSAQASSNTRSTNNTYAQHDPTTSSSQQQQQQQQQYSPPDAVAQYQAHHSNRATLQSTRSYQGVSGAHAVEADSMAISNSNGNAGNAKATRGGGVVNRQSVHTDVLSRDSSNVASQGVPAFNATVPLPVSQGSMFVSSDSTQQQSTQQSGQSDPRRPTPQPVMTSEDMTPEEVDQLIKDHKELREKYTKVKKYYFEKEDQVKQLQNSLAHKSMSQSRTSLDDSEYTTRFNRLDGLIAQLAFSIRKSWRSLPSWLANSVNKEAITTGKQEMTAAGRAFISCWLVEEVFDKYFHPDLEPALSAQLKSVQRNIRNYATPAQTAEEEDYLTSKVVNWRLATLEGLQDALRAPQCPTYRGQMTDMLKEHLCGALATHLQEPPPSDLEGGVHMIVELVVSIAIHLPLESRDVVIEYFMPQHPISPEQMKLESGIIPALTLSIADDAGDRASMKSAGSEVDNDNHEPVKKRGGMLSALTGTGNKLTRITSGQQQKSSAGASSSSLQRPESSAGKDETPRVRMACGIGVTVRGRSVLVKAPVFST